MPRPPDPAALRTLWKKLTTRLSIWRADWRDGIDATPPSFAAGFPHGRFLSNERIFEAFAVALLSGNTRWDRIAAIRADLAEPFVGFDPARYAALDDGAIVGTVVPWFTARRAGSAGLKRGLLALRDTAALLAGEGPGSSQRYIERAYAAAQGSSDQLAMLLGVPGPWKLPGFGIALAAEALRLVGFDLCKPDRHVLRAVGSWKLVAFGHWDRVGAFTPPRARPAELLATMQMVRHLAAVIGSSVSYTNSVIWLAGAVSGARLDNDELASFCPG